MLIIIIIIVLIPVIKIQKLISSRLLHQIIISQWGILIGVIKDNMRNPKKIIIIIYIYIYNLHCYIKIMLLINYIMDILINLI
jgi:hypothetical protein